MLDLPDKHLMLYDATYFETRNLCPGKTKKRARTAFCAGVCLQIKAKIALEKVTA